MPNLITYPRCYTRVSQGNKDELSAGDSELMVLWDIYMKCAVDTETWGFRKRVLGCALRLFGNFGHWVDGQNANPEVSGYNTLFLADTLNYIDTGKRKLHPLQWLELLNEASEIATVGDNHMVSTPYKGISLTQDVIQKWLAWPLGFQDLLLSLYLFFGGARNLYKNLDPTHVPVGIAD